MKITRDVREDVGCKKGRVGRYDDETKHRLRNCLPTSASIHQLKTEHRSSLPPSPFNSIHVGTRNLNKDIMGLIPFS
jgi:hypothetical protein